MELLSQVGISPELPHPPGLGVPQAVEAAGVEVPDAAMHSLEEAMRTGHQADHATVAFYGAPDSGTTSESPDLP